METTMDALISAMEEKLAGTAEQKLRFFRLDELKRNMRRIGHYESRCAICRQFIPETEAMVSHIVEAVEVQGAERRELDRLIFRLSNHMMKEHGYFPKYHFSYRFSILGIFAGVLAGVLLYVLFRSTGWIFPAIGLIAGLFAGQIRGADQRQQNKITKQGDVIQPAAVIHCH